MNKNWPACLVGLAMVAGPEVAAAQAAIPSPAPQSNAVENVVVTAQKRSQKVQDIPITITVLDSKRLAKLDVQSSDQLANYIPAVQIALPSGRGNQPIINIRGIGLNDTNTNNSGPNGVYVDEVYQATPAGQTFQTFDLSRVEVLKGPQVRCTAATPQAAPSISSPPSPPTISPRPKTCNTVRSTR